MLERGLAAMKTDPSIGTTSLLPWKQQQSLKNENQEPGDTSSLHLSLSNRLLVQVCHLEDTMYRITSKTRTLVKM